MVSPRPTDENETLRQLGEVWDSARAELARVRELAERAAAMAKVQASYTGIRGEREAALLKLGEGFYKLIDDGQVSVPPSLKRIVGEVKAKEAEVLRQQADIAAILKEADALAEKSRKAAPPKKRPAK